MIAEGRSRGHSGIVSTWADETPGNKAFSSNDGKSNLHRHGNQDGIRLNNHVVPGRGGNSEGRKRIWIVPFSTDSTNGLGGLTPIEQTRLMLSPVASAIVTALAIR